MEGRHDALPGARDDRPPAWHRDEFGDKITDGPAVDADDQDASE